MSDEEYEPWWESFKSNSTQKSTQESSQLKVFSSSQPSSSQPKAEACSSQDENKSDNEEEKDEDEEISFYLKLGKINYVNTNRINNFFYMYSIKKQKKISKN